MSPDRRRAWPGPVLAALVLLLLPAPAVAQGFVLDLYAGVGLPTGRLNNLSNAGFSGGLGLGYLFGRSVGMRADFAAEWLDGEDPSGLPTFPGVDPAFLGRDIRLYHYDAAIMFDTMDPRRSNWVVAFDVGAGVTTIQFGGEDPRPASETRFSVPIGTTVGYRVAERVAVFLRGRWYLVFADSARFGGSTLASFPIWAGFAVRPG